MSARQISKDIAEACRILFGPGVEITPRFLSTLTPSDVKEIYRRRAREFHPDRAGVTGRDPSEMNELLKDVNVAYDRLSDHLVTDPDTPCISGTGNSARAFNRAGGSRNITWSGPLPDRVLLLCQYLFFSGHITRDHFVRAVCWQRNRRPAFGKIARMWAYLNEESAETVAANAYPGERFGLSAVRQGYLTKHQRKTVLMLQGWLQVPIGRYFVEQGILTEKTISRCVRDLKVHNEKAGRSPG